MANGMEVLSSVVLQQMMASFEKTMALLEANALLRAKNYTVKALVAIDSTKLTVLAVEYAGAAPSCRK